jgi:fluoroacetyl-CoA thioesterase
MPEVFATGFFVGLIEWACIEAVNPHLDWPREKTLSTRVDVTHEAATPPGLKVTVRVELKEVAGRWLKFEVEAKDGVDVIGLGSHGCFVIDRERSDERMARKKREETETAGDSDLFGRREIEGPSPYPPASVGPWVAGI